VIGTARKAFDMGQFSLAPFASNLRIALSTFTTGVKLKSSFKPYSDLYNLTKCVFEFSIPCIYRIMN